MLNPREWLEAGFRDDCDATTLCLVEWPEKAAGLLPPADLRIVLSISGEGRHATIHAGSAEGRRCMEGLK
jgi:tRNA threonylcarbamoyladenosine biosynthesis protein TsaE